jgi:hypothetical protein
MSALPPEADIAVCDGYVRFVPLSDVRNRSKGINMLVPEMTVCKLQH